MIAYYSQKLCSAHLINPTLAVMHNCAFAYLHTCIFAYLHTCIHLPYTTRHLSGTFKKPSRELPNTFQSPSRHLSDTLRTPSSHPPDTLRTSSRYPPHTLHTPGPCQFCKFSLHTKFQLPRLYRSQISKLYTGWVAGGWVVPRT